ncbi:MAG: hypothetical protein EOO44_18170 [Flavobacterium sp.]|nr:MAG: hypothetical protein EOO44_18170 [Flavobacterium sp.]
MLKINEKDIIIISNQIGIPFLPSSPGEGKVCFATNKEVRPEYLESFNEKHILAYISGFLTSSENEISSTIRIPFPENAGSFWKNVEKGNNSILPDLKNDVDVIFYKK